MSERRGQRDDRVNEDHPVRPRAQAFDGVIGIGLARTEMGAGRRGEMAAGREAHDCDPARVDFPLCGVCPDGPDRPAGVVEHRGMMIARAQPIFQNERRDPQAVEPLGDLLALVLDGQHPVAAARADDHGRARRQLRARQPNGDRGDVQLRIRPLCAWRTARPQLHHRVICGGLISPAVEGCAPAARSALTNPARIEDVFIGSSVVGCPLSVALGSIYSRYRGLSVCWSSGSFFFFLGLEHVFENENTGTALRKQVDETCFMGVSLGRHRAWLGCKRGTVWRTKRTLYSHRLGLLGLGSRAPRRGRSVDGSKSRFGIATNRLGALQSQCRWAFRETFISRRLIGFHLIASPGNGRKRARAIGRAKGRFAISGVFFTQRERWKSSFPGGLFASKSGKDSSICRLNGKSRGTRVRS